ncbi:uncharacterized protein [Montipora capricornis]|uniref:uncharacterized protein n=1 Tax=Montipora capricornis TaxID=246305 RepID=UPI0035F21AF2
MHVPNQDSGQPAESKRPVGERYATVRLEPTWTSHFLREQQEADPDLKVIIGWKEAIVGGVHGLVASCHVCGSKKTWGRKRRAPLQQYVVGAPMERIAVDILGPLPETPRKNKFVLVVSDFFTKWTESYPMPNQEASTVAEKLVSEFICRVPRGFHSDQETNFESRVFAEICKLLDIKKTRTTPMHPQSDGQVERFNRTLVEMLRGKIKEDQKDWDLQLPACMMAYRGAVHESTGVSSNLLMLGRELEVPLDAITEAPPDAPPLKTDYAQAVQKRLAMYRIQKSRKAKPKVVHSDRLKPYLRPPLERWIPRGQTQLSNPREEKREASDVDSPVFVEDGQSAPVNEREGVELVETESTGGEEDDVTPGSQNAGCIGIDNCDQPDEVREPEPHADLPTSTADDSYPEDVSRQTVGLPVQVVPEAVSSVRGRPSRPRKPPSRYGTWVDG